MSTPVLALDGHDGAGKTTLARRLAERVGARCVRPFAGERGAALIRAYEHGNPERVMAIGAEAISDALSQPAQGPRVLDRGWLTVSTLVPEALFIAQWRLWLPTVLLWCDLPTTMQRLKLRHDEDPEPTHHHEAFLAIYLQRRRLRDGPVMRTDLLGTEECVDRLADLYAELPAFRTDLLE